MRARMRRARLTWLVMSALVWFSPALLVAAPAEKAGKLVHVADTRNLSGFNLFVANLYNTDRLLFTIFAVGLTAALGLFLGWVMDIAVGAIGLDLDKRHARE